MRKKRISIALVVALVVALSCVCFISRSADNGVKKNGNFKFSISHGSVTSNVNVKINNNNITVADVWGSKKKSTEWTLSVAANPNNNHKIAAGKSTVKTSKDNNNNYRVFNIPVTFEQPAHYQLSSATCTRANNVGNDRFNMSGFTAPLVHVATKRTVTFEVNGSNLGCMTNEGAYRTNVASASMTFVQPNHLVTINNNGGTGDPNRYVACGNKIGFINVPTKTGYNYSKYIYSGTSRQVYSSDTICAPATIVAQWTPKTTTYQFDPNGGTGTMGTTVINYDATGKLLKNQFTRTGYVFQGWSESKDGPLKYIDEDELGNTTDADQTVTLYAVWDKVKDTYQFHAGGGTGNMDPFKVDYETSANLPANTFRKTGYSFAGWSDSETGTTKVYNDKAIVSKPTGSLTEKTYDLYALWTPNTCTVVYDKNHGKGTQIGNGSATYAKPSLTVPLCTYERPGYICRGWSTDPRGTMKYGNKEAISVAPWITDGDRTIKLYAIWEKKTANFNLEQVEKDTDMFTDSKKLKGGNGTGYNSSKTDSVYAVQDEEKEKGYFSRK